jgi:POTRA domain, FtsQ-type
MIRPNLPQRHSGSHVRRTTVRRKSPSLSPMQLAAMILMAGSLVAIFAVSVSPSFAARTLQIRGATFTSESIIRSIVGMNATPNVFRIDTDRAAQQLVRLPAVKSATVQVRLPSTVIVTIVEREPKLLWVIGADRYVVDDEGLLFGLVDAAGNPIPSLVGPLASPAAGGGASAAAESVSATPAGTPSPNPVSESTSPAALTQEPAKGTPTTPRGKGSPVPSAFSSPATSPSPTANASLIPSLAPVPTANSSASSGPDALALPVVYDRRASSAALSLGGIVDSINLDAGFRLARLTPTDVGSSAAAFAVVRDDLYGFTVSAAPPGWVAEFGFYSPTVRQDSIIPEQVRALRSALQWCGEDHVAWVLLTGAAPGSPAGTVRLHQGLTAGSACPVSLGSGSLHMES